ncbi:MAG: CRISPR-associated endonuclease Cas2 [Chloroflexi bacterium AL-N10]|nr:CRISPR-associated endonuclease Cas2 [Chloroflexi bacterium AL-N10]
MLTVVSYDIVDDRRRTKVRKILEGYGVRVQYSVFECTLDATAFGKAQQAVLVQIDPLVDRVRWYRLDQAAVQRTVIQGLGQITRDPAYYLVGR